MASNKYKLILGLISLVSSAAFGQRSDAGYDWRDSSKISTKLLPQHSEFLNNQYPYPAKPRDQWELGIGGGLSMILGDVSPRPGFGGTVSVRRSLGHTFSLRAAYTGGFNFGLDYRPNAASLIPGNTFPNPFGAYGGGNYIANYRTKIHMASLDAIAELNNTSFYRGNPKTSLYVLGGYSFVAADVDVNARNAQGGLYTQQQINNIPAKRKDIRTYYKDILNDGNSDTEYESNGGVLNGSRNNFSRWKSNQLLRHAVNVGGGIARKLSDKVNIGLEQKFTYLFDDNLDAKAAGKSNDLLSFTSLRININMGSRTRSVQPLWWVNPNNFIFNELNAPQHMKIPTPVLPDADGDGITDQFDMEPNTPQGAPVDARGVSRDSDGDGVPDFKDKELLTSQKCFPVDADGVGTCPEPSCCKELRDSMANWKGGMGDCGIGSLPSIQFRSGSATLSRDAQAILAGAAAQIKGSPTCKIRVTGYGASDKRAQQLSWDRVNAVIRYLVERQGISEDRFIFSYGTEGDNNTVDLIGTNEEGPNTVPAPHPNLKRG
ncbi:hypothetical protein EXU57_23960 [Segetibacter sp. 3557_3]|uniref:OmpA family protein n=1 Tax=Segetibacter sp. 3557_3 TaxID=2547429 RepID=UPI0010584801|nr:OmpA family protein [Segetibacter sp. 3557_3]TDH18313.1 hypothetical protein EXU57_23960 [Segetibacter sp. 3557_3]